MTVRSCLFYFFKNQSITLLKNNPRLMTNNESNTGNIKTVYTMKGKAIDPTTKKYNYNLKTNTGAVELNINNVKVQVGNNVKDVNVTKEGINILFK